MQFRFKLEDAAQVRSKAKAFKDLTDREPVIKLRGAFEVPNESRDVFLFEDPPKVSVSERGKTAKILDGPHKGTEIIIGQNNDPDFAQVCILNDFV